MKPHKELQQLPGAAAATAVLRCTTDSHLVGPGTAETCCRKLGGAQLASPCLPDLQGMATRIQCFALLQGCQVNYALEAGWLRALVAGHHCCGAHAMFKVVVMAGDLAGAGACQEVSGSNDARDSELTSVDAQAARPAGGP